MGSAAARAERGGGRLEAADVVESARAKSSPLHRYFEWNDTKAAAEYRLAQARLLIRSVEVIYETPRGDIRVRPFVHVPERDAYCDTTEVMRGQQLRGVLVARALGELESWRRRYKSFRELAAVHAAVDAALSEARKK